MLPRALTLSASILGFALLNAYGRADQTPSSAPPPSIAAVVNATSSDATLAPGAWMSIYGTGLAGETAPASTVPLQESLAGVSVSVNGKPAPLLFVSPAQINALVPLEIEFSDAETLADLKSVTVTVTTTAGGTSPAHSVFLKSTAPAIYTADMTGKGQPLAFTPSFELVSQVAAKDVVVIYAAGLGQTDPPAQGSSGGASAEPLNRIPASRMPSVYIGERKATVLFAGLAPGLAGVYQLNVQVPDALSSDRLFLRSGPAQSNITQIGVPAGQNATNVTGTITGLFPSDGKDPLFPTSTAYGFSLMPQVARFSVELDIAPGASPFTIEAVGEAGSSQVKIDPANGTWTATTTVPTEAVRVGDFSGVPGTLLHYRSCRNDKTGLVCDPVPRSLMRPSLMDAAMVYALNQLPYPHEPGDAGLGLCVGSGTLPSNGHFVIDKHRTELATWYFATFGGIATIPLGYTDSRTAPLRLYVDGKLVAQTDVNYPVVKRP